MLYVSFVLFVYFVVENKDIISQEGHEEHEEIRQSIYAPEHLVVGEERSGQALFGGCYGRRSIPNDP